jgi:hypothetical protein
MTPLELKTTLMALRAEVIALRDRVGVLEAARQVVGCKPLDVPKVEKKSERKMCPHCGEKPNHFFHVKNCQKKNKINGADKEAIRR